DYSYGGIQADNNGNFWTSGTYNNGTLVVQNAPCSELFISEYVEGSSNNKYIEIYNPTNAAINLANYRVAKYTNGSSTVSGTPPTLSGTVGAYSTYVIGYNNSGFYTSCDFTSTYYDFNGNDVIALQTSSGVNIDVIGTVGNSANFAIDTTLRRKSTIQNPTTTYAASEWDTYATDTVSDLGSHTSDCQGPTPELQLVDNTATNQNCGYTIDFGTQALATTTDITFDIENVG
ncbi:MAG: lamin tail domain-containing protein, partial [Mangrovimonas sp.]|nr:lamin tail domain-containing protein [Mangrovimonas sp.]